jgi:hypothetical protein
LITNVQPEECKLAHVAHACIENCISPVDNHSPPGLEVQIQEVGVGGIINQFQFQPLIII